MPKLVYGTAWKKDETAKLVCTALKAGFRGIDTAAQPKHYNEQGVAAGFKKAVLEGIVKREDVFVSCRGTSAMKLELLTAWIDSDQIYTAQWPKRKCAV